MAGTIEIKINGSYLTKDNKHAGVQHEANAKTLRIEFDPSWDSYAKTVTFWNALMEDPVKRVLTADLLENAAESTRIYCLPIPGEPLEQAGELTFIVDGYQEGRRQRSLETTLWVDAAPICLEAGEPTDPTPTQAEQLQVQIDTIKGTIQQAAQSAQAAQESQQAAAESERAAADSAKGAAEDRNMAFVNAMETQVSKAAAARSAREAEAAQAAAESAKTGAELAQVGAQTARSKAEYAQSEAEKAQAASEAAAQQAQQSAQEAAESAELAQAAQVGAEIAKSAAQKAQAGAEAVLEETKTIGVGRSMAGKSVEPTSGTMITAGEGAEIFNDYTERTYLNTGAAHSGNVASGVHSHAEGSRTTAIGNYSHTEGSGTAARKEGGHAEGIETRALSDGSHAEGKETVAGSYSYSCDGAHAEGVGTSAWGEASHAEGSHTSVNSYAAHAEGLNTIASGNYSHAEGQQTWASGDAGHAEGYFTTANGNYSHAEGCCVIADGFAAHAEGGCMGEIQPDIYLRAGGDFSHAEGVGTQAFWRAQHVQGEYNIADGYEPQDASLSGHVRGNYAHIVGNGNSDTERSNAHTLDWDGNAWYAGKVSAGTAEAPALVENTNDLTTKQYVDNLAGTLATKVEIDALTEKDQSLEASIAELEVSRVGQSIAGQSVEPTLGTIVTAGEGAEIFNDYRQREFYENNIEAVAGNVASGEYSHAEGQSTTASGGNSHAEGLGTMADGSESHAEGFDTMANGDQSHAEGQRTTASGDYSHAEGYQTTASGNSSHAEGEWSEASGGASHAEGQGTTAYGLCQHVQGMFNVSDKSGTYAHIVGNGTLQSRSDAHTLDWNGNAWYAGKVSAGTTESPAAVENDNDLTTKQYVDTGRLPAGGTAGQFLQKATAADYDVQWVSVTDGNEVSY